MSGAVWGSATLSSSKHPVHCEHLRVDHPVSTIIPTMSTVLSKGNTAVITGGAYVSFDTQFSGPTIVR